MPAAINNANVILAMNPQRGIGNKGRIPWRLKTELEYFTKVTKDLSADGSPSHAEEPVVIMGKKTYVSIPPKFRALPGRKVVVVTHSAREELDNPDPKNVFITSEMFTETEKETWDLGRILSEICEVFTKDDPKRSIFIAGGSELYDVVMTNPSLHPKKVYISTIHLENVECDTFVCDKYPPSETDGYTQIVKGHDQNENGITFSCDVYERND
jgi:dihydrofolate reductase